MSRIAEVFNTKKRNILNVYCTAGFPSFNSTIKVIKALQDNGADIIELGIPYSDPLADGPIIQQSNAVALAGGMTIKKLFKQLKDLRKEISIPVVLMGYLNPVLQYGFEKFCADAAAVEIDGLIIPDLPEYEFTMEYGQVMKKHGLDFIFLITPETSEHRVKTLDDLSTGFLYAVSSSSTTGGSNKPDLVSYLNRLQKLQLKNPVLVGFGIKDKESFRSACVNSNGAIIGSAYIQAISGVKDVNEATKSFLSSILRP
jgi:tryptophan synthase alpha chain